MWTPGAVHTLTGHGEVTIAAPDALGIVVTAVPSTAGVKVGRPPAYWGLGWLSPGSSSGYLRNIPIRHVSQLELLGVREFDRLGHTLEAGVTVDVTELTSSALAVKQQPWDRNPTPIRLGDIANYATGNTSTMFYWVVPTGTRFWITQMRAWVFRITAATTLNGATGRVTIEYGDRVRATLYRNGVGDRVDDGWGGGPLILPAGWRVGGYGSNADTGGLVQIGIFVDGFMFDV